MIALCRAIVLTTLVSYSTSSPSSLPCVSSGEGSRIFVNIIADPVPQDARGQKILAHVNNLTAMYTSHGIPATDIVLWPPIFSLSCNPNKWKDGITKGRGLNLAHKEVWDKHYRSRRLGCNDKIIIHEYDAFLGNEHAISNSINLTKNMKSDLLYLGYCYKKSSDHPSKSGNAPYCLHAYALTINGTKNLIELVDTCSYLVDVQLAKLANANLLNWDYAKSEYDRRFVDEYIVQNGLRTLGPFLFSGEFIQAKYDDFIDAFLDGTVAHNRLRPKVLYHLRNKTWHRLGGMEEFHSLNISYKTVKMLSDWQFRRFPEAS